MADAKPCWCVSRGAGEAARGARRQLGEESMIGGQKPDQEESDMSFLEVDRGLPWLSSG